VDQAVTSEFEPWNDAKEAPLISIKNVSKKFGDITAIADLSIDIYRKEFFALLGPSGCGKTTLMRMLGGFETPTSGSIIIDGVDMADVPPNKRAVNMMFQSYALFPHLSVWDNIAFGLKRSTMPKDQIGARVDEMLRLTRLEKFARRKPHQISGGQSQRVALARSLAKAPNLLLLDEPLGALDKKLRQDTQFELMDIQEATGTTFVIVTHDQEEAMTVASRVAVMNDGKMIQVDTPQRIYESPASIYVADFIGDVNLIEGHISARSDDLVEIEWAEGLPAIKGVAGETCPKAGRAVFAVRPEKVAISHDRPTDQKNAVQGQIIDIAYLGNMSTYKVVLPSGQAIKAQAANNRRISRRQFTWEDQVWLSWTHTAGLVLPPQ
jgi:putrescine transport system ATP-binding protein